jgi:hypothetical protein
MDSKLYKLKPGTWIQADRVCTVQAFDKSKAVRVYMTNMESFDLECGTADEAVEVADKLAVEVNRLKGEK